MKIRSVSFLVPVFLYFTLAAQPVFAEPPANPAVAGAAIPAPDGSSAPATNRTIIELLNQLDSLQKELRQIRGDFEVVNHELAGIKRRQRELYLDMDRRLREVELAAVRGNTPVANTPVTPAGQPTGQTPTGTPGTTKGTVPVKKLPPTREEKDSYRSAFNMLKEGRYDRSILAFGKFLKKYPSSSYADNAQYWSGEANYVSRKYKVAVNEFSKVINQFPDSTKVPDAMLKLGFTYYELKEWKKAREMLEAVVQNYKGSSAAKLAATRLKRLLKEGH